MRLALYAHYSPRADVARYVVYYLEALRQIGFEIEFVSNSPLSDDSRRELAMLCRGITERENFGYDFAMWQSALAAVEIDDVDELLLTNSSIVGPLSPLQLLWERSALAGCDFWGLTDNNDLAPHLQSYFVVFRRTALASPSFLQFWQSVLPFSDKMQTIRSYEVGLTLWLEQAGLRWLSLWPQEETLERLRKKTVRGLKNSLLGRERVYGPNTTLSCPEFLLESGMPFLKASLFADDNRYLAPERALAILRHAGLPPAVTDELQIRAHGVSSES